MAQESARCIDKSRARGGIIDKARKINCWRKIMELKNIDEKIETIKRSLLNARKYMIAHGLDADDSLVKECDISHALVNEITVVTSYEAKVLYEATNKKEIMREILNKTDKNDIVDVLYEYLVDDRYTLDGFSLLDPLKDVKRNALKLYKATNYNKTHYSCSELREIEKIIEQIFSSMNRMKYMIKTNKDEYGNDRTPWIKEEVID